MATYIQNRKSHFNYELLETLEAGIVLLGYEVKAIKNGQGSIDGAHVTIRGGEAYIINADISPFQPANTPKDYDRTRLRKLILNKTEIKKLADIEAGKGLTIVPISMYNKAGKIKVQVAVARGKRKFDKRETIKKRDTDRDIRRTLKTQ